MQAAYLTGHGANDVVVVGERPDPQRRPGEILVRMQAATLNQVDLYMRNSGAGITHRLPQILGVDGAGIVEQGDPAYPQFQPGDRVVLYPALTCGQCEFCRRAEDPLCVAVRYLGEHRDGTLAEYVAVPGRNVFALPESLDFVEAAALGVNHLTAWRMLFTKARLESWESVLIFGIGGGVSLAALQLARMIGARILVTSRDDDKLDRARALGAHHAINGAREDIAKRVMALTEGRGVDVVIENIGEAVWSAALKSLVRGGRIVTCGATSGDAPSADLRRLFIRQLQVFGSTLGTRDEFAHLLVACARGHVRPVIDSRYPLQDLHAALERLEGGRQFGKIGITLAQATPRTRKI
jgi:NADPH:quinone reductase-like Zn-dependent oxidoreductase